MDVRKLTLNYAVELTVVQSEKEFGLLGRNLLHAEDPSLSVHSRRKVKTGKRLNALKTRLVEKRISIKVEKSVEYAEEVSYFGFKMTTR